MNIASMAFRNIFRYKRRSLITAVAIAFGVLFTIVMDAMLVGAEVESAKNIRDYETGEAKILAPGYLEQRAFLPFDFFLDRADRTIIEEGLKGYRFAPRTLALAELYFNEDFFKVAGSASVKFHAVDPIREAETFRTPRMIESGRWLIPGDSGIVIGSWLADDIGAKVGYSVTIEMKGRGGFYQTMDAEILGIILTDNPYVNRSAIYMDLSYADNLLALEGGVTEYAVRFDGSQSQARGMAALKAAVPQFKDTIYGWDKIEEDAVLLTKTKSGGSKLYLIFMFIIAAVGISNTMLMAVMERKNEIGMLRALGYTGPRIRLLFLMEGFGIGLLGTVAGTAVGSLVVAYMVEYGLDFSFMMRQTDVGYRLTGIMRSAWNLPGMIATIIGALSISSIVAWFPSGRILKWEVADILRK